MLRHMLPTVDCDVIAPLTLDDFLSDVLFPEAVIRLIMADRGKGYDEAFSTWEASKDYGLWKFPVND
jgi:hypothetical protein